MNKETDLTFLEMAYGLAEKAKGRTNPNPCVGAVIVKDGQIAGFGYHEEAGSPHAEIAALVGARARAKGATLFVTLEPCVHWGRTPPCVDSLIQAGLKRIVISAVDPNPLVNGRGLRALKKAGIEVTVGLLKEKNSRLNESYLKYITRKIPFVTLKAAISLDGRISTRTFDSRWISSSAAREYSHLLRGENDAVLIGSGTLLKDDPRLTVRHPLWPRKRIARVVLDSGLRIPLRARILRSPDGGDVLVFADSGASPKKSRALEAEGVEVVRLSRPAGRLPLRAVLDELGKREISNVLVEGGSGILTSFIEEKQADKIYLIMSPKLIGGKTALSYLEGKGSATVKRSLRLKNIRSFPVGDDWIIEGYF